MALAINEELKGINNPAEAANLTNFLRVIIEIALFMVMSFWINLIEWIQHYLSLIPIY